MFALNVPWLAAAALTTAGGRSDPAGVAAFAARGENWSGPVGALAGTGGIWNALTTPGSRGSVLVPIVTAVILALAAFGFGVLRRRWPAGGAARLSVVAAGGFALAVLGTLPWTANLLEWGVSHVPGAGLLRDGHKFLVPYALLLVLCAALGAERLAQRLAEPRARLLLLAIAAFPVAVMPDLAIGGAGQLRPVSYPADWDRVAEVIRADRGEVLSLPFSEYHAYSWNRGRTVIDPAPRYLPADVLADDTLRVGDIVIAGENPRAADVRRVLAAGEPVSQLGVRWVLVQHETGGTVPTGALAGLERVYTGRFLDLYRNPSAAPERSVGWMRRIPLAAAGITAALLLIAAGLRLRRTPTAW